MNQRQLRVLTVITTVLLLVFAGWYFYLHRYRVGTSTPDAVALLGIVAGFMSLWTFFAGLGAWKRKRSPLAITATVIGAIVPALFLIFVIGATVLYLTWDL